MSVASAIDDAGFACMSSGLRLYVIRALIRAKPETKLCLRQIFDSWKQNFAEQVSRWPKASSKVNQSPDDGRFATMSSSLREDDPFNFFFYTKNIF
jgi:hypothetical protein